MHLDNASLVSLINDGRLAKAHCDSEKTSMGKNLAAMDSKSASKASRKRCNPIESIKKVIVAKFFVY